MDNPWAPQQQPAEQPTATQPQQVGPIPVATDPQVTDLSQQNQPTTNLSEIYQKPFPEEVVLTWEAPNRPFKARNRQYYTTVAAIVILVSLILFFAGQFLPIAVVISVGFLAYVLSAVPPGMSTFKLTTYGLRIDDALYLWDTLGRFWFEPRYGTQVLHIETGQFPFRISVMLGQIPEETLRTILSEVLLEQKPRPTAVERAADWLQTKFPIDSE